MCSRSIRLLLPLVVLIALAVSATSADAQSRTTSAVRGSVLQTDTVPVTGALVTIRHLELGTVRSTTSDASGRYALALLQPGGPYVVTVSVLGFEDEETEPFRLQVGEQRVVNVTVEPRALELEGVTVTLERGGVFGAEQVGPATRLDDEELEALPILSRDLMDLAVTSPFVTRTEGGGFSVIGQNDRYNAVLVDGVSNKDHFGLTAGGVPGGQSGARMLPLDAVAQYEVMVAPFDVRMSGFTGGVLNAVTRTGTNDWRTRGSVTLRTESLVGDLQLPTGPVAASGVERQIYSFSAGGPLIRDKAHFYVAGEHERRSQPPDGFNLERDDPALVRISDDALGDFTGFLDGFGVDPGSAGPVPLDTELTNVFARVDWSFDGGSRLSVRNVFANATNDATPNRAQFNPYELSSNASRRTALNNTLSAQYFSELGVTGSGNELTVTVQRTEDSDEPLVRYPQISADLISTIDGSALQREVRAGADFFAQDFDLTQTRIEVTDALTLVRESSTWALGATVAYERLSNRFLPGALGDYFFASQGDLEANAPQRFQRNVLEDGEDPDVSFDVLQWGLFFQNQIEADEGVTLHFGFRLDAPTVLDSPDENPLVEDVFGEDTSNMPGGLLFSPRFGFNILRGEERLTQLRVGVGMFQGQMPYVWLANAFHNNGLRSRLELCEGRITDDPPTGNTAPQFNPTTLPDTCVLGAPRELRTVVVFDEDFKYPQDIRVLVGVDRQVSDDVSFSLAGIYSQALRQVELRDENIGSGASDPGPLAGYGDFDRRIFGTPVDDGFAQNPVDPTYDHVIVVGNESRNWSLTLTAELRARLLDRLDFRTGYTFGRSWDTRSMAYSDMLSNFGFTPTSQDPSAPTLDRSDFDRPHKVVASLSGALVPSLPRTEFSLLYTGQSGAPFSYVYEGDLNGDGYPGPGGAFDRFNDLVYVPVEASEVPATIASQGLLSNALRNDACLAAHAGNFIDRNACRAPWQSRLDLRITHSLDIGGSEVRLEGDVVNVLNLLNGSWGRIRTVSPNVALLRPVARGLPAPGSISSVGRLTSVWSGAVLPERDSEGRLVPTDPWSISSPASQWQMQFGVRVTLDRGR